MPRIRVSHRRGGFTIIELVVVVAIIGLLAAIAIPNFLTYQARSRRSEAYANLAGLARAQKSLAAERNVFLDSGNAYPNWTLYRDGNLGPTKIPWDDEAQTAFGESGWKPDGEVFYSYGSYTSATDGACCATCWTAAAYGDVDGDGAPTTIHYVHTPTGGVACTEQVMLNGTPVDRNGQAIYDAVAPYSESTY